MRSLFFIFIFLVGCKVGPDYLPPCISFPEQYQENQPEKMEEISDEALNHWWSVFHDPFLDELIQLSLDNNLDYKAALEKIYEIRALYWFQFTQMLPELDIDGTASRYEVSRNFITDARNLSAVRNFFVLEFDILWEVDLFGKLRRATDSAFDVWEATLDEVRAIKISIISEVITIYASVCSYRSQESTMRQIIALDREFFDLIQTRLHAGLANEQAVQFGLITLEEDEASLTQIQACLKQSIYSLSLLLGLVPEYVIYLFQGHDAVLHAEGKVPMALPSELLRRRPDVQAAERLLASATEEIGVAVADLFPSLFLTGTSSSFVANRSQGANMGFASDHLNKLFKSSSMIAGIGGYVTAPIFDFGNRISAIDQQIALRNQAYYFYQQTIIAALQETEEALQLYFNEEKRGRHLERELQSREKTFVLATDLFDSGLENYISVLDSQKECLLSRRTLTSSHHLLMVDLIAIYKALGGDWE